MNQSPQPSPEEITRSQKLLELYGEDMKHYPYTWLMRCVLDDEGDREIVRDYRALAKYMTWVEEQSKFERKVKYDLNVGER